MYGTLVPLIKKIEMNIMIINIINYIITNNN
jgi:hypothetical protein